MAAKKTSNTSRLLTSLLEDAVGESPLSAKVLHYLEEKEKKRPPYIPLGYHPSGLDVDSCPRAMVYERLGVPAPSPFPAEVLKILENGTAVGQRVERYLVESGILAEDQTEVPIHGVDKPEKRKRFSDRMLKIVDAMGKRLPVLNYRGHMDGFDPFHSDGPTVFEIKGVNSFTFNKLRAPSPKHMTQTSIYAAKAGSKRINFIYESKDTQKWKEFVVEPDMQRLKAVEDLVKKTQAALKAGELPGRHSDCPSMNAARPHRCVFASVCFSAKKFKDLDARTQIEARDYR